MKRRHAGEVSKLALPKPPRKTVTRPIIIATNQKFSRYLPACVGPRARPTRRRVRAAVSGIRCALPVPTLGRGGAGGGIGQLRFVGSPRCTGGVVPSAPPVFRPVAGDTVATPVAAAITIPARGPTRRGVLVETAFPPRRGRRRAGIRVLSGARLRPSTHTRSTKSVDELEDMVGVEGRQAGQLRVGQEKAKVKRVVRAVLPEVAGEVAHRVPQGQSVSSVVPVNAAQRGIIQAQVQEIVVCGAVEVLPSPWREGGDHVRVDRRDRAVVGEGGRRRSLLILVDHGARGLKC